MTEQRPPSCHRLIGRALPPIRAAMLPLRC
jgi:hypothetical protein